MTTTAYKRHKFIDAGQSASGKRPCRTCGKERGHENHPSQMHYYAVKPKGWEPKFVRIERAGAPEDAIRLAFGRPIYNGNYEWKDLGTRVAVIQSDNKRIALLTDPKGWNTI